MTQFNLTNLKVGAFFRRQTGTKFSDDSQKKGQIHPHDSEGGSNWSDGKEEENSLKTPGIAGQVQLHDSEDGSNWSDGKQE